MESQLIYLPIAGIVGLLFAFWKTSWIQKQDEGSDVLRAIGKSISEGAMAFLKAEYRVLGDRKSVV